MKPKGCRLPIHNSLPSPKPEIPSNDEVIDETVNQKSLETEALYNCTKCDFRSQTLEELQTHEDTTHPIQENPLRNTEVMVYEENVSFLCTHCEESFQNQNQLEIHVKTHKLESCPLCDDTFPDLDKLSKHLKDCHTPYCSTCETRFNKSLDLEKHILDNHMAKTFPCNVCQTEFDSFQNLSDHAKEHISTACPKCPLCGLEFETNETFRCHFVESHSDLNKPKEVAHDSHLPEDGRRSPEANGETEMQQNFICNTCGHNGISIAYIERHILDNHVQPDVNGRFKCDECDNISESKDDLWNHFNSVHKNQNENDQIVKSQETGCKD